jgi:hypothetical protein
MGSGFLATLPTNEQELYEPGSRVDRSAGVGTQGPLA